jgi:hypothetical protein
MYADALIIERADGAAAVARRIALGETAGRDEAWLRDTLLAHPGALPIGDIDPSFGLSCHCAGSCPRAPARSTSPSLIRTAC